MAQYWTGKRDSEADLYVYDDTNHVYILVDKDAVCAENRMLVAWWFKAGGLMEKGEEEGPVRATLGYREKVPDDTPFPHPPDDWDGQGALQIEDEHWDKTDLPRPVLPKWAYDEYQFWVPGVHGEADDLLVWDKAHGCYILVMNKGEVDICWHFTPGSSLELPSTPPEGPLNHRIDISNVFPPPPDDFDGSSLRIEWGNRKARPKLPYWGKGSEEAEAEPDPFEAAMNKDPSEAPPPSTAAGVVSTPPDPNATAIMAAVSPDQPERDPGETMMVAPVPFHHAAPEPATTKKRGRLKDGVKAVFRSWPAVIVVLLFISAALIFYVWGTAERALKSKKGSNPPAKTINVMAPPKQPPGMPPAGMASQANVMPPPMKRQVAKMPDAGTQVDTQALKAEQLREAERLRKAKTAREAKLKREREAETERLRKAELQRAHKLRLRATKRRRQRLAHQSPRRRPKRGCKKRVDRHCVDGLTPSEIHKLRNRIK